MRASDTFDFWIDGTTYEVLVAAKYLYCDHKDYPACGCDFKVIEGGPMRLVEGKTPRRIYWFAYPIGAPWRDDYKSAYYHLRDAVAARQGFPTHPDMLKARKPKQEVVVLVVSEKDNVRRKGFVLNDGIYSYIEETIK